LKDLRLVKIWKVNTTKGIVKVVTIEQGPRKPSLCEGCSAPCCKGMFRPILTEEEFLTKKFPTTFLKIPNWLKEKVPNAEYIACLAFTKNPYCQYFDPINCKCKIFPNCPKACLAYDCREDPRPEMKEFVKKMMKKWSQQ